MIWICQSGTASWWKADSKSPSLNVAGEILKLLLFLPLLLFLLPPLLLLISNVQTTNLNLSNSGPKRIFFCKIEILVNI